MESVLNYIKEIKRITTAIYYDDFKMTGEEIFMYGGCFEFVKVIQNAYTDSKIYIKYDDSHCAILIDDILYDVSGVVKDKENYHEASLKEIEYMEDYFGQHFKALNISQNIINSLNDSSKIK